MTLDIKKLILEAGSVGDCVTWGRRIIWEIFAISHVRDNKDLI